MDTKFVISQLITAVIVIITTYVTVRLTTRNKDETAKATSKFRTMAKRYKGLVWSLFWFCISVGALMVRLLPDSPPSRFDVVMLVILTPTVIVWTIMLVLDIRDIIRNRNVG